jgi:hypothetical protein
LAYHALGREQEAVQRLEHLKASKTWNNNVRVAEVYSFWGDVDQAFSWLLTPGSDKPRVWEPLLYASPLLKPLHGDVRWASLTHAVPRT